MDWGLWNLKLNTIQHQHPYLANSRTARWLLGNNNISNISNTFSAKSTLSVPWTMLKSFARGAPRALVHQHVSGDCLHNCMSKREYDPARTPRGNSAFFLGYWKVFNQHAYDGTTLPVTVFWDLHTVPHELQSTQKGRGIRLHEPHSSTHRRFYTEMHRAAFAHKRPPGFYAQKFLHTSFTQRSLYTEHLSNTEAFTHKSFTHTHKSFTHTRLYTQSFYTQTLLRIEACSQSRVYTEQLLHRERPLHRAAYTILTHTETLNTQMPKLLHRQVFTHRGHLHKSSSHRCGRCFYT